MLLQRIVCGRARSNAYVYAPSGERALIVDGLCFAGDTVFRGNVGRAMFPGGDELRLAESLRSKLLPLPDEVRLYPGHGRETSVGEERANWLRYLDGA